MRLWIFVLCLIIVSALSIWGCVVIIDAPLQVIEEVSDSDFTDQDYINEPIEAPSVKQPTLTSQPLNQSL